MAGNLDLIDTIIILILENRSFDHVLGYLSRGGGGVPVEGIRDDPTWLAQHSNSWNGTTYPPHPISRMSFVDPPHGSRAIADQIGQVPAGATPQMDGFVKVYANGNPKPDDISLVMGYYTAAEVPMFDFLARNYSGMRSLVRGAAGGHPAEQADGHERHHLGRGQCAVAAAEPAARL